MRKKRLRRRKAERAMKKLSLKTKRIKFVDKLLDLRIGESIFLEKTGLGTQTKLRQATVLNKALRESKRKFSQGMVVVVNVRSTAIRKFNEIRRVK